MLASVAPSLLALGMLQRLQEADVGPGQLVDDPSGCSAQQHDSTSSYCPTWSDKVVTESLAFVFFSLLNDIIRGPSGSCLSVSLGGLI